MTYFPAPTPVATRVFTRLPDKFRKARRTAWADANRMGAAIDSFLEGPSFDREGRLYCVDIPFGRVFRISSNGSWELITEYDGWPNGLKIHKDGRVFITDYKNGLMELNPNTGAVTPIVGTVNSEGFKGVNDLVFASSGDVFFTDQGQTGMHDPSGRVYRLAPDGKLTCLLNNCPSPNGIALSPNGQSLYVAMTRSNQVWRVPLQASGLVAKVSVFANLHGGPSGPDGLAVDVEGGLLICHSSMGIVWRLNHFAIPTHRIDSCEGPIITNLAFGKPDMKTVFMTESISGSILCTDLEVPGLQLFSHQ